MKIVKPPNSIRPGKLTDRQQAWRGLSTRFHFGIFGLSSLLIVSVVFAALQANALDWTNVYGLVGEPIISLKSNPRLDAPLFNSFYTKQRDYTEQEFAALSNAEIFLSKGGKYTTAARDLYWGDRVRSANSSARILSYEVVYGRSPEWLDYPDVNRHEDWFLHDTGGKRINNGSYSIFDLRKQQVLDYLIEFNTSLVRQYNFDGIFIDNLNCASRNYAYLDCSTFDTIAKNMLTNLRSKNPKKLIFYNGVMVGYGLANDNLGYANLVDGVFIERFGERDCTHEQPAHVLHQYLDRLIELDRMDKLVIASANNYCDDKVPLSDAAMSYYQTTLAVFLLGKGKQSYFRYRVQFPNDYVASFLGRTELSDLLSGQALWDSDKQASYTEIEPGVYFREFEGARVYWNTSATTFVAKGNEPSCTILGERPSELRVPPGRGIIFLKHCAGR